MVDYEETIKQGRAMVRIIEAANVLLPGIDRREAALLSDVKVTYQKRLRNLVADLPVEVSAQIFAASERINGPIGDTTLN